MSENAPITELSKGYDPHLVEARWYESWTEQGFFHTEGPPPPGRSSYCITIPPPNVTGELHMGHALQHSIHDVLIRWKRMLGHHTLCVPGMDHAGIGTQRLVERSLAEEGLTKEGLGREKFLERMWEWTDGYGGTILSQLRTLGCSYDWRRTRFTLDEGYVQAVLRSFVDYYNRGWIYRGIRITNWCPACRTALSDLEVEHEEVTGSLWRIRYPFADGNGSVTVATTRPETMLGDTAVAVHPDDPRHVGRVGRRVVLPLMEREIPVIGDPVLVDPAFGTGAVKVTPAHDPNDYEAGRRNGLPQVVVIGRDGRMTEDAKQYAGLDRLEARRRVVDDLEVRGLIEGVDDYTHGVGHCERCKTVIEPLLSEQWYVKMSELAAITIDALEKGAVRFVPERYARPTIEYLREIRDWCISRQLWWGHRIPIHTCSQGHQFAAIDPDRCAECGDTTLEQDPDVLDTWFSSALWPFAVLGWPGGDGDLKSFYPTDLLITDRQIIRLWVVRMIFSSLHFLESIPFPDVYVHATVLTRDGKRMSKSKGTGIDPMDLIGRYGADATRFGLLRMAAKGQDIRFTEEKLEGARFFSNKLWNASRFVMMHLGAGNERAILPDRSAWRLEDRWIVSRLQKVVAAVNDSLADYAMDTAADSIYEFVWNELCDWYLELAKPRLLAGGSDAAHVRAILLEALETSLRLLHPFMPFVTEEIWTKLRDSIAPTGDWGPSIMVAPYPLSEEGNAGNDASAEEEFGTLMEIVGTARRMRSEAGVTPGQRIEVLLAPATGTALPEGWPDALAALARANAHRSDRESVPQPAISDIAAGVEVFLPLSGLIDIEKESARLSKEIEGIERDLAKIGDKLNNTTFLAKAPPAIVEKERAIHEELRSRRTATEERLHLLRSAR